MSWRPVSRVAGTGVAPGAGDTDGDTWAAPSLPVTATVSVAKAAANARRPAVRDPPTGRSKAPRAPRPRLPPRRPGGPGRPPPPRRPSPHGAELLRTSRRRRRRRPPAGCRAGAPTGSPGHGARVGRGRRSDRSNCPRAALGSRPPPPAGRQPTRVRRPDPRRRARRGVRTPTGSRPPGRPPTPSSFASGQISGGHEHDQRVATVGAGDLQAVGVGPDRHRGRQPADESQPEEEERGLGQSASEHARTVRPSARHDRDGRHEPGPRISRPAGVPSSGRAGGRVRGTPRARGDPRSWRPPRGCDRRAPRRSGPGST